MALDRGHMNDEEWKTFCEQTTRVISACLVGNTNLKSLSIISPGWQGRDCFDSKKLLCDVTSIESIFNSNHTLESIFVSGHKLSTVANRCLELNLIKNKAEVIRQNMLQFYFVGEFDLSPFINMPLFVLPQIMSQRFGDDDALGCKLRRNSDRSSSRN
jgi:hypothetical protein